jgi:hypothetical protein
MGATVTEVGKRFLGFVCVVVLGAVRCNNEYSLAPTPCDDYCLALQRAECPEDWPDDCVSSCELTRSPTKHPACADQFDALLGCYQNADDGDFFCADDRSEPRRGVCAAENQAIDFCIEPVFYRCTTFCQSKRERCRDDVDWAEVDWSACLDFCSPPVPACEEEAMRYYDCELENDTSCGPSPLCFLLHGTYLDCLNP